MTPPQNIRPHIDANSSGHFPMDVPAAPRRKRSKTVLVLSFLASAAIAVTLCAIGGMLLGKAYDGARHPALSFSTHAQPARTGGPAKAAPAEPVGVGDGTFEIGGEVAAGTYTTTASADGFGCYWARLRDFNGDPLKSIIANGNLAPGAKGRITLSAKDAGVELTGGCVWVKK